MKPCSRTGLSWDFLARRSDLLNLLLVLFFILAPLSGLRPDPVLAQDATLNAASWDFQGPTGWAGRPTTVSVSVTSTDGLQENTAQYRYVLGGSADWSGWSSSGLQTSSTVSTTVGINVTTSALADSASNRMQFRIQDTFGATLTSGEYTIAVDASAPGSPISLQASPAAWTKQNRFTFSWSNPADVSGIQQAYYKLGSIPSNGSDYTGRKAGTDISQLVDLALPLGSSGVVECYIWLEDGAGNNNYASAARVDVRYDPTPPVTVRATNPSYPAGGWYSSTVTVNLSASDEGSGVQETRWKREGGAWNVGASFSVAETQKVYYQSEDKVGNIEEQVGFQVNIDTVAPNSSVSLSPGAPASGWYNVPVQITISATDSGGSGVQDSYYRLNGSGSFQRGSSATVPDSGSYSLEFYSRDVAGNSESVQTRPNYFQVDRDAPTVTATLDKPGPWAEPPVVITLHVSDGAGSGVDTVEYRLKGSSTWTPGYTITINGSDGSYSYEYRARDKAGNVSAIQTVSVGLDNGAPGSVTNLASEPQGWSKISNGFALSWVNPSEVSGIAGAYYQVDIDPLQGGTPVYVAGDGIDEVTGISVGSEGEHTAYVWLQDKAGNSNPNTRRVLERAFRYDATAPNCDEPTIVGPREDGKHYTGPIRFTITGRDPLSGIAAIHYQIDNGPVVTATVGGGLTTAQYSFTFAYTDTRTLVYYWATDTAGNTQASHSSYAVYFDTQAPAAPIGMSILPSGWVSATAFTITWTNPWDYSFIAGAYYKVGSAPQWPSDGTYVALTGDPSISAQTTKEGATQVYLWLKDKAGNTDYRTAATVTVQRDATPPETTISATGAMRNGYYIGAATLSLAGSDSLSGVAQTRYRIDDGAEKVWDGQGLLLEKEGTYRITYYSVDRAGNREVQRTKDYTIDLKPPVAKIAVDGGQDSIRSASLRLRWSGNDGGGSGIARYTVEYRRGKCAAWQSWYSGTDTSRAFNVAMTPNNYYYFRIKAEDRAGYISEFSVPDYNSYVYYDGLVNGSFDATTWNGWTVTPDGLGASLVITESHTSGATSRMVQLSRDWPIDEVPENAYASFYQQIQLPTLDCSNGLMLTFWYRIYSRDVISDWVPAPISRFDYYDTFDVYIKDRNGAELARVLRDGNNEWDNNNKGKVYDLGWRKFTVDISPWMMQGPIRMEFRVDNRWDSAYPTWVLVDDVQLVPSDGRIIKLPLITAPPGARPAGGSSRPATEVAPPTDRQQAPTDTEGLPSRRESVSS
jgi:hypothetical protein